jgi:hypothetical protein
LYNPTLEIMKGRAPIILALGLILTLVFAFSFVDRITPLEMTRTAMGETFVRISLYAERHKALPPSLDVLPKREGYENRTTDGWNRPLQYTVASDGVITLKSFGADGKPGGDAKNADISESYRSRKPDGSLWAGLPMWIVEAEAK